MVERCPLALCKPGLLYPHPGLPRGGLPLPIPHPRVDSLQKTLGLAITLALPSNSLPLLLLIPISKTRAPPWRLCYCGAGWALPFPLVQPLVIVDMHVVWWYYVMAMFLFLWYVSIRVRVRCELPPAVLCFVDPEFRFHFRFSPSLVISFVDVFSCPCCFVPCIAI